MGQVTRFGSLFLKLELSSQHPVEMSQGADGIMSPKLGRVRGGR